MTYRYSLYDVECLALSRPPEILPHFTSLHRAEQPSESSILECLIVFKDTTVQSGSAEWKMRKEIWNPCMIVVVESQVKDEGGD